MATPDIIPSNTSIAISAGTGSLRDRKKSRCARSQLTCLNLGAKLVEGKKRQSCDLVIYALSCIGIKSTVSASQACLYKIIVSCICCTIPE